MIVELKKNAFENINLPLASVEGDDQVVGQVMNYYAPNQAVVTRHELEVYVKKSAVAATHKVGEEDVDYEPELQIVVEHADLPTGTWTTLITSKNFDDVDDLKEGTVLFRAAMPQEMKQYVRVKAVNGGNDNNDFADGEIVGVMRPM